MAPKRKCCLCNISTSPKLSSMGITIHKFPHAAVNQKEIVRQWCRVMGDRSAESAKLRKGELEGLNFCSLHFEEDCFVRTQSTQKKHRLKPDAIPTKCLDITTVKVPAQSKKMVVKLPKTPKRSSKKEVGPSFTMEDELETVNLDPLDKQKKSSGALAVNDLLRLQRKFLEQQSASVPYHMKLSVLLAEEQERHFDDDVDLTHRTFKPIQLVSWLRLHRAHKAGQIRVRLLFNADENSSRIVVLHPSSAFDATSIDIHNIQPDMAMEIPQLVNELLHPHASAEAVSLFALLAHDGTDWRLMGRLDKDTIMKGCAMGPKSADPEPPTVAPPYQDPRLLDELNQKVTVLSEMVSVINEERLNATMNEMANPAPATLPSFFKEEEPVVKKKLNRGLLGSIKYRKMQVKLINYRVKVSKATAALEVKEKEIAELRREKAERDRECSALRQKMDLMTSVLKPGLASIMSSTSGLFDNLNLWTLPPAAPPTPAASPQPLN